MTWTEFEIITYMITVVHFGLYEKNMVVNLPNPNYFDSVSRTLIPPYGTRECRLLGISNNVNRRPTEEMFSFQQHSDWLTDSLLVSLSLSLPRHWLSTRTIAPYQPNANRDRTKKSTGWLWVATIQCSQSIGRWTISRIHAVRYIGVRQSTLHAPTGIGPDDDQQLRAVMGFIPRLTDWSRPMTDDYPAPIAPTPRPLPPSATNPSTSPTLWILCFMRNSLICGRRNVEKCNWNSKCNNSQNEYSFDGGSVCLCIY